MVTRINGGEEKLDETQPSKAIPISTGHTIGPQVHGQNLPPATTQTNTRRKNNRKILAQIRRKIVGGKNGSLR
jgi:hypothetical protein